MYGVVAYGTYAYGTGPSAFLQGTTPCSAVVGDVAFVAAVIQDVPFIVGIVRDQLL